MDRRLYSSYIVQLVAMLVVTGNAHAAGAQLPLITVANVVGQCRDEKIAKAKTIKAAIVSCGCPVEEQRKRTEELSDALARDLKACDQLDARAPETEIAVPEEAADLVAMLGRVAENLHLPKGPVQDRARATLNCQYVFRELGRQLRMANRPSWGDDFPDMNAAEIVGRIDKSARGNDRRWREVRIEDVQALANQGRIVVGGQDQVDGYGHLGIAFPIPPGVDPARFDGRGPFVKDGNEHQPQQKIYPSTYGAVKASEAFYLSKTKWYLWLPSSP